MSDLEGEICYDIDVEDEEVEFNSFLKCCQKFNSNQFLENIKRGLSWVLTNIGLICVVVCYCLLGALTFRYVEQENELEVRYIYATIVAKMYWYKRNVIE